jgi:type I restriction enzyme, S subunit
MVTHIQSIAIGAAVPGINLGLLKNLDVVLPPITVQRKVVGLLSAYDDLIENNIRRIAILEGVAQAVYREWFVGFRFPGHEKVKQVNSPLGRIPEGWKVQTIGSTLDFHIGGGWGQESSTSEFSNPAFVIRGTDIPEARSMKVADCPLRYHTDSNIRSRRLVANDLVFEVSGGSKGQPVGRCLFVSDRLLRRFDGDVICASFCKLIRANHSQLAPELLYQFLLQCYTDGTIEKYEVQSTGIKNFKFTVFLDSESLAVPPSKVQESFVTHVRPIMDAVHVLGKKTELLRSTRDLLLPKLISGQLDVEELDIDIGAAVTE